MSNGQPKEQQSQTYSNLHVIPTIANSLYNAQNTRLRVSYILYSSADSAGSPVLKDVYFLPHNDSLILYRSLLQQRNSSPIARTLPDGSSASLEALVRAIEVSRRGAIIA